MRRWLDSGAGVIRLLRTFGAVRRGLTIAVVTLGTIQGLLLPAFSVAAGALAGAVGDGTSAFWLYGEELDLCTRLRDAGWKVVATPALEVLHVGGVSTGRSRRTHLMHSQGIYRYYRKHRATGWRRATLPLAWAALRARAELVALREGVARRQASRT